MGEELAGLLRHWRARLKPADVGLPKGPRRRVPGLRREEVADLAGLTVGQYARLERGQRDHLASGAALRLARALRLDTEERLRLLTLIRSAPPLRAAATAYPRLRPDLVKLVAAIDGVAATVLDPSLNVLVWNRAGHALLAGHLDPEVPGSGGRHNLAAHLFLDPQTRCLYPQWDLEARRTVALLHHTAAREPDHPGLAGIIGELTSESREFAALWRRPPHHYGSYGKVQIRHPLVGLLPLAFELIEFSDRSGNRLLLHHAEPSPAARAAFRMAADLSVLVDTR